MLANEEKSLIVVSYMLILLIEKSGGKQNVKHPSIFFVFLEVSHSFTLKNSCS